jgi:hypothetical protein
MTILKSYTFARFMSVGLFRTDALGSNAYRASKSVLLKVSQEI